MKTVVVQIVTENDSVTLNLKSNGMFLHPGGCE